MIIFKRYFNVSPHDQLKTAKRLATILGKIEGKMLYPFVDNGEILVSTSPTSILTQEEDLKYLIEYRKSLYILKNHDGIASIKRGGELGMILEFPLFGDIK